MKKYLKLANYILLSISLILITGCKKKNTPKFGLISSHSQTILWIANDNEILLTIQSPKSSDATLSSYYKSENSLVIEEVIGSNARENNLLITLKDGNVKYLSINGSKITLAKNKFFTLNEYGKILNKTQTLEGGELKLITTKLSKMKNLKQEPESSFWLILGLIAQLLFSSRMIIQWYASEKAKKSVMPILFWYFSLAGSSLLLAYAIYRKDPVFILGQGTGFIVYIRNLY
jgi:lipid-A-disaccharide synthase-like uncharacterized protein